MQKLILVRHSLVEVAPFALWRRLGLPSFAVLTLPGFDLLTVVEGMEVDWRPTD